MDNKIPRNFFGFTRRYNDTLEVNDLNDRNNMISNYHTMPIQNSTRQSYTNSLEENGVYQSRNRDMFGSYVDNESGLRNGMFGNQTTHVKEKNLKLLRARPYASTPFMGAGETHIVNPDLYSQLVPGFDTKIKKSTDSISGVSIDRFIPLVPCLAKNVQNTKHIIPEYWIRGGMDTRGLLQNANYYRTCGK